MMRTDVEKIVAGMDPSDGYRCEEVTVGSSTSLHLGFKSGGKWVLPPNHDLSESGVLEVWSTVHLTNIAFGEKQRYKLLYEALCRFINTGGNPPQLQTAVDAFLAVVRGSQRVETNSGFRLIDSEINTDGDYEHLFAKKGCPWGIRWVEGQFVDVEAWSDKEGSEEPDASANTGTNSEGNEERSLRHPRRLGPATTDEGCPDQKAPEPGQNGG